MAEQKTANTNFNFSSMDWDSYIKFRPVYPEEVYSTIYRHHDQHSGSYDSAVDLGAGVGIVSAELSNRFSHVTVTDPSEAYLSSAKSLFKALPSDRMTYLQTKAEELSLETLPSGKKVDLVTAAECLHWADVEAAAPRIASVLKPGGTFAAWLYGVRPLFCEESENLAEAKSIFYDIYDKMCYQYDTQIAKKGENSGAANMNARLDHMPFAPDLWTDVQRIHNNTGEVMAHGDWPASPAKVRDGETVKTFSSDKLLFQHADYEYLEGYLVNWIPPIKVKEFAKEELAKLQAVIGKQKIGLTWPFVLVLATKK